MAEPKLSIVDPDIEWMKTGVRSRRPGSRAPVQIDIGEFVASVTTQRVSHTLERLLPPS